MEQGTEKMDAATQLHHALSTLVKGKGLKNVKFFLGDNRNITAEQLCTQAISAVTQIKLKQATKLEKFDTDFPTATTQDLLS